MADKVKQYLDNIRHYTGLESAYNEQLLQIRLIGYTAPISSYCNNGGKSGTQPDSIQERYILALEECEEEIKKKASEYARAITKFYNEVERLPSVQYKLILLYYYGSKKTVKDLAITLDKCESSIKKMLAKARKEFANYCNIEECVVC